MAQSDGLGKHGTPCHIETMPESCKDSSKAPVPPVPGSAQEPTDRRPREIGGPKGPEPTRYGDWEVNGRCSDF